MGISDHDDADRIKTGQDDEDSSDDEDDDEAENTLYPPLRFVGESTGPQGSTFRGTVKSSADGAYTVSGATSCTKSCPRVGRYGTSENERHGRLPSAACDRLLVLFRVSSVPSFRLRQIARHAPTFMLSSFITIICLGLHAHHMYTQATRIHLPVAFSIKHMHLCNPY